MDTDGTARIAGLGSASILDHTTAQLETRTGGSHQGSAPELIYPEEFGLSYPHNTKASDIHAFGVLAWEARVFAEFPKLLTRITPLGFHGTRCLF